jgi:hypothetical protein
MDGAPDVPPPHPPPPLKKRKREEHVIRHADDDDLPAAVSTIDMVLRLDGSSVAGLIFSYLPKCHRFLAAVNRTFRTAYQTTTTNHDGPAATVTSMRYGLASPRTLALLLAEHDFGQYPSRPCVLAAKYGCYETLQYLTVRAQDLFPLTDEVFLEAARNGHLHCLRLLLESARDWPGHDRRDRSICNAAAENGHLECLQYAHTSGYPITGDPKYPYSFGFPTPELTIYKAAVNGHLDCLKYVYKQTGFPEEESLTKLLSHTAFSGNLSCLIYIYEVIGCEWHADVCANAADKGHLHVLKYAFENGCPWDQGTCDSAAARGHLQCLKYAHENGCELSTKICVVAAYNGHLACLQYAHENGCSLSVDDAQYFACMNACEAAAENGHLDCLTYAHVNGCEWGRCDKAAFHGHLHCLRYAHENGYYLTGTNACEYAALYGHLDCLVYAHENGCALYAHSCPHAANRGHRACLEYLYTHGCYWDLASFLNNKDIGRENECYECYRRRIETWVVSEAM